MESTQRYGESSSSVKVLLSLEEPARKTRSVTAAQATATLQRLRADPGTGDSHGHRQRTAAPPPCSTCAEISEPFPSIYSTVVKNFKRIIRTRLSVIFCIAVAKQPFTKVVRKIICSRLMFLSCACESRCTDPHPVPPCLPHRPCGAHADAVPGRRCRFLHKAVESRSAGTGGRAEDGPSFLRPLKRCSKPVLQFLLRFRRSGTLRSLSKHLLCEARTENTEQSPRRGRGEGPAARPLPAWRTRRAAFGNHSPLLPFFSPQCPHRHSSHTLSLKKPPKNRALSAGRDCRDREMKQLGLYNL